MQRDLTRLADGVHDVVVVGGGIHGACIAWDAALRGLRVALIERDDFGAATSANSLRIVHGGLRYLARGDLARMRESIRERSTLLRIAPTLVEPLPVVVPTAGAGPRSRPAMAAALALTDLLSLDRNRDLAPDHQLPRGRLLSSAECLRLFPAFPAAHATGGALWYDARVRQPERLTLAFVRSAADRGAVVANYCRMERLLHDGGAVRGVAATDLLGGGPLEIRARAVVVAAGPWTPPLAEADPRALPHAFALNVEVDRRLAEAAIGVRAPTGAAADPIVGGHRFIFLVPQGETTLLGTWYAPSEGPDTPLALLQGGTEALLAEFRAACPGLELAGADVLACQWGRLPLKAGREPGRATALADRPRVIDHGGAGGVRGMFSVEGVKYTTARRVAEDVVNRVVVRLGIAAGRCGTAETPVDARRDSGGRTLEAGVRRAIREEMAVRLSDVILRRTSLSRPSAPTRGVVAGIARIAAAELGWTPDRQEAEIDDVMRQLRPPGQVPESGA